MRLSKPSNFKKSASLQAEQPAPAAPIATVAPAPPIGSKVSHAIQRLESSVTRMAQRQPHVKYSFDSLWEEVQEGRKELAQIVKRLQELEGQG